MSLSDARLREIRDRWVRGSQSSDVEVLLAEVVRQREDFQRAITQSACEIRRLEQALVACQAERDKLKVG